MTRRDLIATTGAAVLTAASQSRVWGADERLTIALIGCGVRGLQLQPYFQKLNGPLVAVCDVWRTRAEKAQSLAPGSQLVDDHRKGSRSLVLMRLSSRHPITGTRKSLWML